MIDQSDDFSLIIRFFLLRASITFFSLSQYSFLLNISFVHLFEFDFNTLVRYRHKLVDCLLYSQYQMTVNEFNDSQSVKVSVFKSRERRFARQEVKKHKESSHKVVDQSDDSKTSEKTKKTTAAVESIVRSLRKTNANNEKNQTEKSLQKSSRETSTDERSEREMSQIVLFYFMID